MTKNELIAIGDQTFDELFKLSQYKNDKEKTDRYCELHKQLINIKRELKEVHNTVM